MEEFVEWLNSASDAVHADVITIKGEAEGVSWDIALQYTEEFTENLHSYVNNISTTEGGTHVSGFRSALTRAINAYGKKNGLYKDLVPTGEDLREGLTAVISVRVPHPQFEGQTKTKLGNGEVEGIINSAVGDFLAKYLEENPKSAKAIISKGVLGGRGPRGGQEGPPADPGAEGRPLRRRAAGQTPRLHQPRGGEVRALPRGGRLVPAAVPKGAGFGEYQAILPLRGKIINAYKSREDKVLANEEVRSVISAIGAGIGPEADLAQAAVRQGRDHDRRRCRRLPHPHAAADLLLPPDVPAGGRGARLRRPAAAVPRAHQEADLLRPDRGGDEEPAPRSGARRGCVSAGRRPGDRRRGDAEALPHPGRPRGCPAWPWSGGA